MDIEPSSDDNCWSHLHKEKELEGRGAPSSKTSRWMAKGNQATVWTNKLWRAQLSAEEDRNGNMLNLRPRVQSARSCYSCQHQIEANPSGWCHYQGESLTKSATNPTLLEDPPPQSYRATAKPINTFLGMPTLLGRILLQRSTQQPSWLDVLPLSCHYVVASFSIEGAALVRTELSLDPLQTRLTASPRTTI